MERKGVSHEDLARQQEAFSAILLGSEDPELRRVAHIASSAHQEERLAVYRNNMVHSLKVALADTYPVITRLVGDDFLAVATREYLLESPPKSALLMEFAAGFAEFLSKFRPARKLAYLADVARLEYLWQCSYQAAEAGSLSATDLAEINPEVLSESCFQVHPSLFLLSSPFAVGSIWSVNQPGVEPRVLDVDSPEYLVLVRRGEGFECHVQMSFLDQPGFEFIRCLCLGDSLAESMSKAALIQTDWDGARALACALHNGFFVSLEA